MAFVAFYAKTSQLSSGDGYSTCKKQLTYETKLKSYETKLYIRTDELWKNTLQIIYLDIDYKAYYVMKNNIAYDMVTISLQNQLAWITAFVFGSYINATLVSYCSFISLVT